MRIVKSSRVSSVSGRTIGGQRIVFRDSLLCAKGYPFHARERRFSRPHEHPTYFQIDRSNVFLVTASLPGTTVGPFQRIERNAR